LPATFTELDSRSGTEVLLAAQIIGAAAGWRCGSSIALVNDGQTFEGRMLAPDRGPEATVRTRSAQTQSLTFIAAQNLPATKVG
jgi:hypothetical protein